MFAVQAAGMLVIAAYLAWFWAAGLIPALLGQTSHCG
jgi:hypothetical protein